MKTTTYTKTKRKTQKSTQKSVVAIKKRVVTSPSRVRSRVKLAVVPNRANQYRPHILRRYGIAIVVALVVVAQVAYNGLAAHHILGDQTSGITVAALLSDTNQERADNGESPLKINSQLSRAAELKVQDMFASQYWAHDSPTGTTPWHWFDVVGYNYSQAGENLAKDFSSSDSTVAAWMDSPTHRANILKASYQDAGFAVQTGQLDGKPATIVVALYGNPTQAATTVAASSSVAVSDHQPLGLWSRFQLGLMSLTPAAVASLAVLAVAILLAVIAHLYRRNLPSHLRRSWYRNHGIYKAIGLTSLAVVIIMMYGSVGQV